MKRLFLFLLALALPSAAWAQGKRVNEWPAVASPSRSDMALVWQPGASAGTQTRNMTMAQIFATMNAADIATALGYTPFGSSGGTLTGALILAGPPSVANGAATKNYVDALIPIPGGTSGQGQYNNAGAFGGYTVGGDCTANFSTGAFTCTKTNGTSFATVATSGSASDLGSGTLPAARLPNPSSSTLGGVQSYAAVSNQFLTSISTSGVPASAQPSFSNISGSATSAQLPTGSTSSSTTVPLNNDARLNVIEIPFSFAGSTTIGASVPVVRVVSAANGISIAANPTWYSWCDTAPTASMTFTLKQRHSGSTTSIGNIVIGTGGTVTSSPTWSAVTLAQGEAIIVTSPSSADATANGCGLAVNGARL